MMFEPINAFEDRITPGQGRFNRSQVSRQRTALFVDARLQGAMPGSQLKQFRIHSDLLR